VPDAPTHEQLLALVDELSQRNVELERVVAVQADRIAELQRRLGADSSNSSRPPSSDPPWDKTRAKKRSSRTPVGAQPGQAARGGRVVAVAGRGSGSGGGDRAEALRGVRTVTGRGRRVRSGAASGSGCGTGLDHSR